VLFSFALAAVVSGEVSIASGVARFAGIVFGELAWGVSLGWAMLRLRRFAEDPRAEVLLALASPYLAFWPPHELGGSGVIACVACGLYVSWNGRDFISPATRLQGYFIWDLVSWTVEAVLFLLTGLQAHRVLAAIESGGLDHAFVVAGLVSLTVILIRFAWVFPVTYLPRLLPWGRRGTPPPDWRATVLVAYTGLRGAVSLAAALSIPIMAGAEPFPQRDLILFTTFVVIAVTLVGQGAPLPRLVHGLDLARAGREEAAANRRDEDRARIEALEAMLAALDQARARGVSEAVVASIRQQHADRRRHLSSSADVSTPDDPISEAGQLQLELVQVERGVINRAYLANRLTDEARRRIERELDLEEAQIRHVITNAGARSAGWQEARPLI
jgi:CPA1 family monovalent cation:H+ antiporter